VWVGLALGVLCALVDRVSDDTIQSRSALGVSPELAAWRPAPNELALRYSRAALTGSLLSRWYPKLQRP